MILIWYASLKLTLQGNYLPISIFPTPQACLFYHLSVSFTFQYNLIVYKIVTDIPDLFSLLQVYNFNDNIETFQTPWKMWNAIFPYSQAMLAGKGKFPFPYINTHSHGIFSLETSKCPSLDDYAIIIYWAVRIGSQ